MKRRMGIALMCAIAALSSSVPGQSIEQPFSSTKIESPWTAQVTDGATVVVKDGWATFEGPLRSRAQIEMPARASEITVSAAIARWAGVYVVWDENNWCAVGKIYPTPFGRFSTIVARDGKLAEIDHRGIDFNGRHFVRVRVGRDHVAFQYQLDGQWTDLRVIERPKGFAGTPKLVAAGKFTGDNVPYGGGAKISGAIDEVRIEPTAAAELTLTAAQLKAVRNPPAEPVSALLEQGDDDPTYEQIVGHYPAFRYPREAVGVALHRDEIGVDWLGRIDASPWAPPKAWFFIGDKNVPFGEKGESFRRRLLDGYLPIVTLSREIEGVEHEMTVFGASEGFSVEKPTVAYVRFVSRAKDSAKLPKQITLAWGDGDNRRAFPTIINDDRAECFISFAWPKPAEATAIDAKEFERWHLATAANWRDRIAPAAARFDVPDQRVMEGYRAWLVYSMINTDTINGRVEPHDGGGFYDSMFGNSVSLYAIAMDQYGLHDYAEQILAMQCHFQRDDGVYVQDCGLVDVGGFIAGLAKHYHLTGDREWLKRFAPHIGKQCEWIIRQRELTPKDGILRGLIKMRPYNDYPDPVYNYLGNAWCAAGMKLSADVLKEIDAPESAKYAAEAERYRKDILDSMQSAAFQRDGMTLLDMEPDTQRLLKLTKYTGGDYWGLIASPLLATDILPADDPRTTVIVDMLEKRGGLIAGVCEFHGGIDHAYTFGYLNNALKRDEVRKALLGFWSFFAFGMTRDTYSPVEVTMIHTGENEFTLPHLYSCTEQLRLLRNLLIREDGDTLWIGQGVPRAWLAPGKHIAITKAPTDFGDVSCRIESLADGTMNINLTSPTRKPPKEIRIRLRHPRKFAISGVESSTPCARDADTITLRDVSKPTELKVRFPAE